MFYFYISIRVTVNPLVENRTRDVLLTLVIVVWRPRDSLGQLQAQFGDSRVSQVETSPDTVWPIEYTSLTFMVFSLLSKLCFKIVLGRC